MDQNTMHFGTSKWSALLICPDEGLRGAAGSLLGGLSPGARDLPPPTTTFTLTRDGHDFRLSVGEEEPRIWPDQEQVLVDLHWNILNSAFQRRAGVVSIHAGLVDWGTGGVLITGDSEYGKTTLVLATCRAGALFGGDDLTMFDPGTLEAIPFPITAKLTSLEEDHLDRGAEYPVLLRAAVEGNAGIEYRSFFNPAGTGGGIAGDGLLSAIIIRNPRFTCRAELNRITPAAGLQRLFGQVQIHREDRVDAFEGLSTMMERVPVFEAVGEAEDLVELIPECIAPGTSV